jgi:hypothetical protein
MNHLVRLPPLIRGVPLASSGPGLVVVAHAVIGLGKLKIGIRSLGGGRVIGHGFAAIEVVQENYGRLFVPFLLDEKTTLNELPIGRDDRIIRGDAFQRLAGQAHGVGLFIEASKEKSVLGSLARARGFLGFSARISSSKARAAWKSSNSV